ncbi:hypothetical protein [Anaeromyxobacter diazotrophicus]|nr:hypothetical protein [Anaeromyxobacter diazotrophicus]
MRRSLLLVGVGLLLGGGRARAQELVATPSNKFELRLASGYGQGLGPVAAGVPTLQELGSAGGTLLVDLGYRLDPRWEVGVYGEFGLFGAGKLPGGDQAFSLGAGLQGQLHLAPAGRFDPWVGLGVGWRGYWSDLHGGAYGLQGLDLARFQVGLDYRVAPTFAVGPVAGITLTKFLSAEPLGANGYNDTRDRKVNAFVFGGVGGRFEL